MLRLVCSYETTGMTIFGGSGSGSGSGSGYSNSKPGSSLYEAIRTVALANFDRRTGRGLLGLRQDIDKQYGNTLRVVAEEAALPSASVSDHLLLAVQMLGIYEMMSTGGNNMNFLQAHSMGMAALYKSRASPIIRTESDWLIFRGANLLQVSFFQ